MTSLASIAAAPEPSHDRVGVLDGWRAISILLVIGTHMLPLGLPEWRFNSMAGPAGMAIFFTLSGYLITTALHRRPEAIPFLVRRVSRIVPLAFVGSGIILFVQSAPIHDYLPLWFFYWNYRPTPPEIEHISHFWSLSLEMQFYVFVAALTLIAGRRGLLLLPLLALVVTGLRIHDGQTINIKTHYRADEILCGATLALCQVGALGSVGGVIRRFLERVPLLPTFLLLLLASHQESGWVQYTRPYLASTAVGATLMSRRRFDHVLESRPLRYVAEISYALYVIHPATMMGWMGTGGTVVKYLKRVACIALAFGLAHVSTYRLEQPFTELGRSWAKRLERRSPAVREAR